MENQHTDKVPFPVKDLKWPAYLVQARALLENDWAIWLKDPKDKNAIPKWDAIVLDWYGGMGSTLQPTGGDLGVELDGFDQYGKLKKLLLSILGQIALTAAGAFVGVTLASYFHLLR
jgi:hypothetical protein